MRKSAKHKASLNTPAKSPSKGATVVHSQSNHTAAHYSEPIPPASEMERYNKINGDLPARIMMMAEDESLHRRSLEVTALDASIKDRNTGQWLSFFLIVFAIVCTGLFAFNGLYIAAYAGAGFVISLSIINTIIVNLIRPFLLKK